MPAQPLLSAGMAGLLRTAQDEGAESWTRAHAFNCLCLAFNDRNLGVETSGYFAQGARCCRASPLASSALAFKCHGVLCDAT